MKSCRLILIVGCSILSIKQIQAQYYIGAHLGAASSSISWKLPDINDKYRWSRLWVPYGGLTGQYRFPKSPFSIMIELNYLRNGAQYHTEHNSPTSVYTSNREMIFHYVDIPTQLCYTIPSLFANVDLNFIAGSSIGVIIDQYIRDYKLISLPVVQDNIIEVEQKVDRSTLYPFNLSAVAGVGLSSEVGHGSIIAFTARYAYGLSNAMAKQGPNQPSESIHHRSLLLSIGYCLML